MELVPTRGAIDRVGAATVWFRLVVPLVAGEDNSPLMRVAAAADFGNGVSAIVDWSSGWLFINPDLTIYLNRYPAGEWVALEAVTHPAERGVAFAESAIYDRDGRIGRSVQSLLMDRAT
jgi:Acyl-CoA thioesterase C-terminal domain